MKIPFEILSMLSYKGFIKKFYFYTKKEKTYKQAYERTEKEYKKYFNKRRYASYDSFRVVLHRKMKQSSNQK
jgi:ribosomal protein S8